MKKENAVTIVSLIVIVIILLILVGISIFIITGENGLIEKASWSNFLTEFSAVQEAVDIKMMEREVEKNSKNTKIASSKGRNYFKLAEANTTNNIKEKEYPVLKNGKVPNEDISPTLVANIKVIEKIEEITEEKVELYKLDLKALNLDLTKEYIINIKSGNIYRIKGQKYKKRTCHRPDYGNYDIPSKISLEINSVTNNKLNLSLKAEDLINGINTIQFPDNTKKQGKGETQLTIDFQIDLSKNDEYNFKLINSIGEQKEKTIIINTKEVEAMRSYHKFEIEESGLYKIEAFGASGGYSRINGYIGVLGGNGGYTSGEIYLNKGENLYLYIGGHGADAICYQDAKGGYNGGGLGTWDYSDNEAAGAGGGATDIRLVAGEYNDFEALKSRIMVAAGGGGSSWYTSGGAGGGLEGLTNRVYATPGTQNSGYKFGIGQDGYGVGASDGVGGAGGGYYGGNTSDVADACEAGAGGSSFVSGYELCNAIDSESTEANIIHTNQPNHYSGKIFKNAIIKNGTEFSPISQDGLVRITKDDKIFLFFPQIN